MLKRLESIDWTLREIVLAVTFMLLLGEGLWYLLDFSQLIDQTLRHPFPLDYVEGPVVDQVFRLTQGIPLYPQNFNSAPFTVTADPPLFAVVQQALFALNGPSLLYGRVIAVGSAVVASICVTLICHSLTRDWIAAIGAGLLLPMFPHLSTWSLLNAPETTAFALSLAGLCVVLRAKNRAGLLFAALLLTAAALTRPAYFVSPLLAGVVWLRHRRNDALLFGFSTLGTVIAAAVILSIATQGAFFINLLLAAPQIFVRELLIGAHLNVFVRASFITLGIVLFALLERFGDRSDTMPAALTYLVSAVALSVTTGMVGANLSHMFEVLAGLCICGGTALAWFGKNTWIKSGLLLVLLLQIGTLQTWTQEQFVPPIRRTLSDALERQTLRTLMAQTPDPILTDEFIATELLRGKRPEILPAEFMRMNRSGRWEATALVEAIQSKRFSMIVWYEPQGMTGGDARIINRWPESVRNAVYANYRQVDFLASSLIYVRRDSR